MREDALRFPATVANYPDRKPALTLGIAMPRTMTAHLWTWALMAVTFDAPDWRTTAGGGAELRRVIGPVDRVGCETQWLNMSQIRGKGGDGAPKEWQGVYKLAQTLGVVICARREAHAADEGCAEAGADAGEVDLLSPSTWRAVALKGLDWRTRENARQSEQAVAALLLGEARLTHVGGRPVDAYTGGGLDLLTADPRADLSAALCIGLAVAEIPWYAVTPVLDLPVRFGPTVPLAARARVFSQARG